MPRSRCSRRGYPYVYHIPLHIIGRDKDSGVTIADSTINVSSC